VIEPPDGIYYDGSFDEPTQHGPVVPLFDNETQSMLYRVVYQQREDLWKPPKFSAKGPHNSLLVEVGQPRVLDGNVLEWEELYAHVPATREDPQPFIHNYQAAFYGVFVEIPKPVTSTVLYEYFHAPDPSKIKLTAAYRIVAINGVYYSIGKKPKDLAKKILAEDQQLERWKGNIWCRTSRYVPRQFATVFAVPAP
jgi:hypothetical protein